MITGASKAAQNTSALSSFSVGFEIGAEQKSLMTLVDLASTLFDQQIAMEEKCISREQQQDKDTKEAGNPPQQQHQPRQQPPFPSTELSELQSKTIAGRKIVTPCPLFPTKTAGTKHNFKSIHNIMRNKNNLTKKRSIIPQTSNFQCCTREGFLSKLFSVLQDESLSDVLSWMPDGKAFTIVSSREFSKSGMVYDLFGIRKMSSFLRRLNQLDFARIRDPTDPNNLDVFRKPGFMAHTTTLATAIAERATKQSPTISTKTDAQKSLDSPTSTLMFSPALASTDDKTEEGISNKNPVNLPSVGSTCAIMPPRTSSLSPWVSTKERQGRLRSNSNDSNGFNSLSTTQSSWVCSTPETGGVSQTQPTELNYLPSAYSVEERNAKKHPLPRTLVSMPPSMPIFSSGGPVLLRARSESYERSPPPPSVIAAKPLMPPPIGSFSRKTPTATKKLPLMLSPGTFQALKLPNLEHVSQSEPSVATVSLCTTNERRPPPLEFVVDYIRKLVEDHPSDGPIPMEVEEKFQDGKNENDPFTRPKCPFLGTVHVQTFPKLQHVRDYIRLYKAAENEADAILDGGSESLSMNFPSEASVLAHVELLQGHKRRKVCEVTTE